MNRADARLYRETLGSSVAFKGLPATALDDILNKGMLLEAKAGDLVFFQNLRGGPGLYVVLSGEVEVFRSTIPKTRLSRSRRVRLNTLTASDCFGEYSLIDGKESSASAKALVSTVLFFLPRGEFLRITEQDPVVGRTIYYNLLLFLIERLRQKDQFPHKRGEIK